MVDEKKKMKKKSRVVVGGESSRLVGVPEQLRMLFCPVLISSPLILPLCVRLLEELEMRGDDWTTRAQKLTMSQRSSLWVVLCRFLVDVSRRESRSRRQSGEPVSFRRRKTRWIQLDYRFVSFQASQNPLTFYWDVTLASFLIR